MTNKVVFIFADDMRKDMLKFMPFVNSVLKAQGTSFENAYCNVPICNPARITFLLGQNALKTNRYQNDEQQAWGSVGDQFTYSDAIPNWLKAVTPTVTTGAFGKMPNGYRSTVSQPGWDTWNIYWANEQQPYDWAITTNNTGAFTTPGVHHLNYLKNKVKDFLNVNSLDRFAWWCTTNPHVSQLQTNFKNHALPSTQSMFNWYEWPIDQLTSQEISAGVVGNTLTTPSWIRHQYGFFKDQQAQIRVAAIGQIKECYDLDAAVKSLYDSVDLSDTTFIFSSDGGVFHGEHRSGNSLGSSKDSPYSPAANIPLIIKGPGFPAGQKCYTAVSLADVTATISDIFNAVPTIPQDGTSLLEIISKRDSNRGVLYQRRGKQNWNNGYEHPDASGIFTETHKLIRYKEFTGHFGPNSTTSLQANFTTTPYDEYEMFDLRTDPREKVNLAWNGGEYLTKRNELEAKLDLLLATI